MPQRHADLCGTAGLPAVFRRYGYESDGNELTNQIEYDGGEPIAIESAIFGVEDTDLYTFYLSPSPGTTDIASMEAAKDYLRILGRNPRGTVDTASEPFEISYKDIFVKGQRCV